MMAMFGSTCVYEQFFPCEEYQNEKQVSINRWTYEIGNDGGFK